MAGVINSVAIADNEDSAEPVLSRGSHHGRGGILTRANGSKLAPLARMIEVEVVPRLVLARRVAPRSRIPRPADDGPCLGSDEVGELAALALTRDEAHAAAYVEALRARGTSVETLYLDLLAPTARHLGDLWTADRCNFADVTVGLGRLQRVLHGLGLAFREEAEHRGQSLCALLVPVPGEQHTFGLLMVVEFFRRAGWDIWSEPLASTRDLIAIVRSRWFAVVGLSASSDRTLDALASSIRAVRRASRNRAVGILVGGPVFAARPELVALVGADATASDGLQATLQARHLLDLLPRRC